MRILIVSALAAFAAWALDAGIGVGAAVAQTPTPAPIPAPAQFPVPRGTAPPPPLAGASAHAAPPEGVAPGGVDFGHWRSVDATTYAASFETQMTTREQGKDAAAMQADLQANGFVCDQGTRLDCRIEIDENGCTLDWYVVLDGAVHAGYENVCLTPRR